jgi:hypothetical protein
LGGKQKPKIPLPPIEASDR